MSQQSSDTPPVELTPRQARLRRQERDRRRRRVWLGVAAVVAVAAIVGIIVVRNNDDSDSGRADTRSGGGGAGSTTFNGSTATSAGNSTTGGSEPTPEVVSLPAADASRPPDPPVALYRQGKLFLEGSVPSESTAFGYAKKFGAILGPGNVYIDMKRDPRVAAGPLRVIVQEQYQFPTGSNALDPKYEGLLNLGIFALRQLPEAKLVITGYTDSAGPADVNQSLSEQRARIVADYMVVRGIPADRIVALGRGPADPIADNSTPEGRQRNRRIEATLEGVTP